MRTVKQDGWRVTTAGVSLSWRTLSSDLVARLAGSTSRLQWSKYRKSGLRKNDLMRFSVLDRDRETWFVLYCEIVTRLVSIIHTKIY